MPTAEFREMIFELSVTCPKGKYASDCPFHHLAGLGFSSRKQMLAPMDRTALLSLFEMTTCKCPADPRIQAVPPAADGGT
jgi:hypothetical protein